MPGLLRVSTTVRALPVRRVSNFRRNARWCDLRECLRRTLATGVGLGGAVLALRVGDGLADARHLAHRPSGRTICR